MATTIYASAIAQAVEQAGSQAKLAKNLGVTRQAVWNWLNDRAPVPVGLVLDIERLTGVSRHDLRSDIYPREA